MRRKFVGLIAAFSILLTIRIRGVQAADDENGCDRYVKCRNELLRRQWSCAEQNRRIVQHTCKIGKLYRDHTSTSYRIESEFGECTARYSAISDINQLLETDPTCTALAYNPVTAGTNCWSDVIRITQQCYMLSRCCPVAQKCTRVVDENVISEQFELEKSALKVQLEGCVVEMDSIVRDGNSANDDAIIAQKVSNSARHLLRTVVPFRIVAAMDKTKMRKTIIKKRLHKNFQSAKEFAAPITKSWNFKPRRQFRHKYGISKPKYATYVRAGQNNYFHVEPPTSSLRPFTELHEGSRSVSTQPPAFSPFTFNKRKLKKRRRHRKKKHSTKYTTIPLQHAFVTKESRANRLKSIHKLDELSRDLKQKGEYLRNFIPKMLLVRQNEGTFLGYAQPYAKQIDSDLKPKKSNSVDQIYDDIIESQAGESTTMAVDDRQQLPPWKPPVFDAGRQNPPPFTPPPDSSEGFVNSNGAWTVDPPSSEATSAAPVTAITFPPIISRVTFPTLRSTTEASTTTTTNAAAISEPPRSPPEVDPLIDYITHELLDKHMELPKTDDDFDFSSSDYIDISAIDIPPTTTPQFAHARYEQANSSVSWPMQPSFAVDETAPPQFRTTAAPVSADELSAAQANNLIPLPMTADKFGTDDVTPSAFSSTPPTLDNQLWPIPIRKRKMMGAAMKAMNPIVILPVTTKKPDPFNKVVGRTVKTGCQRYEKCLKKEYEMRLKCFKEYPPAFDKCSEQLLPLYKNSSCRTSAPLRESDVDCENVVEWSRYCRELEECCPARGHCESQAANDHAGIRLKLLEKSFALRASACQFKRAKRIV
ncbi:unnamed protein product [Caenorhabditis bovis]|uniref:Domain of unknown function DB domain-containing protein n=1 Tax=Caenorhabditis bovis TaxID=2654633 RepID=A0A8S1EYA7_9PELO|nr:unnamed protein product [Caenorhabditis bovis]